MGGTGGEPLEINQAHNDDAERGVLGAIINNNDLYDLVAEHLDESDFFQRAHMLIWRGIAALLTDRRPVDTITLLEVLAPYREEVGGMDYLSLLETYRWNADLTLDYTRIVKQKSSDRRIVVTCSRIAEQASTAPALYTPNHIEELLAFAEHEFAQIAARQIYKPEASKGDVLNEVIHKLEHGQDTGLRTGFATLDERFGGFNVGQLSILAARTSKGKTAIALNWALNVAKAGKSVGFFTLEQPVDEVYTRLLGIEAHVDTTFHAPRYGLVGEELKRLKDAREALVKAPITLRYRPRLTPRMLRTDCKRLAREQGPLDFVVIDYFGLMKSDKSHDESWQAAREVVLALKEIAGELNVPMLVLWQLNRDLDERQPPTLANLRDTGAAEEHASNVIIIWSPKPAEGRSPFAPAVGDATTVPVELVIAKQRNGPAGAKVPLRFHRAWGTFEPGIAVYDAPRPGYERGYDA